MTEVASERRRTPRQKTLLRGKLYYNNRLNVVDCLIRDISDQGARLVAPESVAIPEEVDLHIPQKDQTYSVRIVWRHEEEIGVAFVQASASQLDFAARLARLEEEIAGLKRIVKKLREASPDADVA